MGYESFSLSETVSKQYKKGTRTNLILALLCGTALGFTCGIIVGHYGIEQSNENEGNAEQIVGGTDSTSVTSPQGATSTPQAATSGMTLTDNASAAVTTSTTAGVTTSEPSSAAPTTSGITTTVTSETPVLTTTTTPDPGDTTTATSSGPTTTTGASITTAGPPTTTMSSPAGVCLPGVSEDIIREADETITELIFSEMNPDNIATNLGYLVQKPHVAGTQADKDQADYLKKFWEDNGLDVAVTTPYDVMLSYPDADIPSHVRVFNSSDDLVLESPAREDNLSEEEHPEEWPFPYLGYSGNGTVNGSIVYANYGREEDFMNLDKLNISVNGSIVLARYGKGYRGDKVRFAEERGAVAVILYSDPADYVAKWATDYYPDSIWIPPSAVSRGSILMGTGDPATPGYPAIASAFRLSESEAILPRIPAIPIRADFAQTLMRMMGGPEAPTDWTGNLGNVTYRLGPGFDDQNLIAQVSVHTKIETRTSYNAFGMIRGQSEPDRYVMLGNHRDSWVLGAIDPSSGTATMMELSRVLGQLVRNGTWRPRRTIIFCSWGSEEFALIGSTEWIEENAKILDARSVAYINMDIAVTGNYSLRGLGSPPIFTAMYNATKRLITPGNITNNETLFDNWKRLRPLREPENNSDLGLPVINTPGAGSDYGYFQIRAGITCADFRYEQNYAGDGVAFYPLYHTGYETFKAVSELIDPGFVLHATIGKLSGELLRNLADSLIIPFNMRDYTLFLRHYAFQLKNASELKTYEVNVTELDRVIDLYDTESSNFHLMVDRINKNNPLDVRRVNDQMMFIERAFLDPRALPGRDQMYRHLIHSTPQYLNPLPRTSFPGMQDAIYKLRKEPDNPDYIRELQHHFSVLVFTIQSAAYSLKNSTAFLRENI